MLIASLVATLVAGQVTPASYRPEEIRISLERTVCFGSCPAYTITILGDGTVKYVGTQFVGVVGSREDKIAADQVARLVTAFLQAWIFDSADSYDGREIVRFTNGRFERMKGQAADLPSRIIAIELGARKKRVVLRDSYPAELGRLPDLIDDVTQSKRWTARKN